MVCAQEAQEARGRQGGALEAPGPGGGEGDTRQVWEHVKHGIARNMAQLDEEEDEEEEKEEEEEEEEESCERLQTAPVLIEPDQPQEVAFLEEAAPAGAGEMSCCAAWHICAVDCRARMLWTFRLRAWSNSGTRHCV